MKLFSKKSIIFYSILGLFSLFIARFIRDIFYRTKKLRELASRGYEELLALHIVEIFFLLII